ncbi:RDD family protein [Alteromonas sp. ASW11-36]|uniref:RDD family protein n=2 Tax=Alteromonas arenosi TaxID=3055817 RepID=A0ABT7STA0_9ALTE|nr:RDD family protein [Alteromonas sp. ASW11-36]MDM7859422.1 RDD family protein [Alteromonas sp. ASW11-36]
MTESKTQPKRAGFFKRLAAMVYDVLVATAVAMCAALVIIITLLILYETNVIPHTGGMLFNDFIQQSLLYTSIIQAWVLLWVIGFFLYFWKNGGQTLGMRAWRLRMYSLTDKPVGYGRLLLRMISAFGGLGTLLVLLDFKHKLALQDRISQIEVLSLSKEDNHHRSW